MFFFPFTDLSHELVFQIFLPSNIFMTPVLLSLLDSAAGHEFSVIGLASWPCCHGYRWDVCFKASGGMILTNRSRQSRKLKSCSFTSPLCTQVRTTESTTRLSPRGLFNELLSQIKSGLSDKWNVWLNHSYSSNQACRSNVLVLVSYQIPWTDT